MGSRKVFSRYRETSLRCGTMEGGTLEVAALTPTSSSEARAGNQWMPSLAQPRSLQAAAHAGAPCPRDVKAAMIAWWGPIIHELYLGNEGAGLTHDQVGGVADTPGLRGRRGDRRIRIFDEEGEKLPSRQVGIICWVADLAGGAPLSMWRRIPMRLSCRRLIGQMTPG